MMCESRLETVFLFFSVRIMFSNLSSHIIFAHHVVSLFIFMSFCTGKPKLVFDGASSLRSFPQYAPSFIIFISEGLTESWLAVCSKKGSQEIYDSCVDYDVESPHVRPDEKSDRSHTASVMALHQGYTFPIDTIF